MRVGIIAIQHESNTFLPSQTTLENFEADTLLRGSAMREYFLAAHHEVGGFFAGTQTQGIEAVPIFAARAIPSGIITHKAAQTLVELMLGALDSAQPLDGLLVAPHGAAVSELERDFDGFWLGLLRARMGTERPIICTLDLHANVSARMIDACDATIAYRTNPHLDQRQCGLEAAKLIAQTLRGEIKPTQAAALPPIAINMERQLTDASPCRELMALVESMRQRPGVLGASAVLGFPYADVAEVGSSFIAVTDDNPALARSLADELAAYVLGHKESFDAELISIDCALDEGMRRAGPVCLLDIGDNVGGGSPADGTALARAIHERGIGPAVVCINDSAAAAQARAAGAGNRVALSIGGRVDQLQGPPLITEVRVRSLHDGVFQESAPRHGGKTQYNMGPCAVVETGRGLTILLTSRRTPPFSLGQITSCGIRPADYQILVAKGVHAPVAAYREACRSFIRVNTPGVTTADMKTLPYNYRRRPLFPLEQIE